ncbi:hypothetical protein PtA15_5A259 [Puccinia triticina]|uniref:Uncharacterized protein n=1 Tax=Puccinia triticina TaxID=208348 RepID=A0ABY7CKM3_9BASI|nr:uncharacterized protein PtA15_5A259 [Puccinia triticina]WAQ84686.1 hypothetical protein PtA15_5A259 [Puccinia triticina]
MTIMTDDFLGKAHTYGKDEALAVCKLFAALPGYLSNAELSEQLTNLVVEEMIAQNFIYFRPLSPFSRDLVPPHLKMSSLLKVNRPELPWKR